MSTTAPAGSLAAIATAMKATAQATPNKHAFRRLTHGLNIVYGLKNGHWRIAIGRTVPHQPSHQELEIVAKAFGAPFDFEPIARQATWWDPIHGRSCTYNVVEITWRELEEPAAEPVEAEPTAKQEIGYAH